MVNFLPIQQHLKIRYNLYHRQNWVITALWSWSPLQNEDDLFSFVLLFEIQILSKTRLSNNKPKLMLPHAEDNEKHFLCCGLISEWGRKGILERGNVFGASFLHFNWGKRKRKEFSKIKSLGVNTNLQSLIDIQNLWFSVKFVVELKDFFLAGLEVGVKLLVKVFTRWSGLLASPAPGTSTAASAGWGSTAPVGCTTTEGFVDATASAKKKIIVFK